MSEYRIDDYLTGAGGFLLMFLVSQLALWLGRNAHVRHDEEHKDH